MCDYVLFENATGYALFEVIEAEDIGTNLEKVQESVLELTRFGKMVKLKAFVPFKSAEEALANINDITEGASSHTLPAAVAAAAAAASLRRLCQQLTQRRAARCAGPTLRRWLR